ncbi:hypothetical protein [Nocardia sp. NBC_01327]|uniref:hypothetical protein n=1 Tax=Nocardia sp. NBC_01327 TaxID=2903593 RepID=UPI002E1044DB|nr:hypothetical protein OG326_10185 [Nocardia sp. NBC_01327]
MTNNGKSIDWDGELQELMESSGLTAADLIRPRWTTRAWRTVRNARAALTAIAVVVPLMWLISESGAPAAATMPLLWWLAGWIGYGIWISVGRPDWATTFNTLRDFGTTAFGAGSRFAFEHSRPLRARIRVWRAARDRNPAAAATA